MKYNINFDKGLAKILLEAREFNTAPLIMSFEIKELIEKEVSAINLLIHKAGFKNKKHFDFSENSNGSKI